MNVNSGKHITSNVFLASSRGVKRADSPFQYDTSISFHTTNQVNAYKIYLFSNLLGFFFSSLAALCVVILIYLYIIFYIRGFLQ